MNGVSPDTPRIHAFRLPKLIASQVDEVAGSMLSTEKTLSELTFATGFDAADDAVPELLRRERAVARE